MAPINRYLNGSLYTGSIVLATLHNAQQFAGHPRQNLRDIRFLSSNLTVP